ncbi:MAG TPA: SDR family oxidoreductase [Candidatus Eremiobacteraceae bacterium]|nr:SDR family oxidoreductase [Candidatus Eremiobacteraceae bacterium]
MRVLVTGATGYIGGRLVPRLIAAGHFVRCLARSPKRLAGRFAGAEIFPGDVRDSLDLPAAFAGIDVAYYLIHSMGAGGADFQTRDRETARNFATAAKAAGVKRIIYLGGLGDAKRDLSEHLRSRHEVGDILRDHGPPVTEFRAAIVIGSGSVSFEMIRYLTERLPVMIAPKWVATRSQPIAVGDVLEYLVSALAIERTIGRTYDIGGRDIVSYRDLMLGYARARGLRRTIVGVPFFTPRLSSYWIHIVTPVPASIARPLIDGLRSEMIVQNTAALSDFDIRPIGCEEAIRRALDRYSGVDRPTTWFDAYEGRQSLGEFRGIVQGMLMDRRERRTGASPSAVFAVVTSLGGSRGWLYADWLWALRGMMDWALGGNGMRRGRRSPASMRIGDAVDLWRVEALEPDRLLRLRAEMKLPGNAWLEFAVVPDQAGSTLRLTAFFEPRGLAGQLYWYAVAPIHDAIFAGLADQIVKRGAALGDAVSSSSGSALEAAPS